MKEAAMQGSGQDSTQRQMIESRDWEPVTDSYNGFTRWRHKRTGETVWTAGNPALATPPTGARAMSERDPIPCPVCREVIIGPLSAAAHLSDTHGLSMYGALARLAAELEEARSHARRAVVALRAICDEASICGPPLERRREEWEAALSQADEVLGELEVLYGAR